MRVVVVVDVDAVDVVAVSRRISPAYEHGNSGERNSVQILALVALKIQIQTQNYTPCCRHHLVNAALTQTHKHAT